MGLLRQVLPYGNEAFMIASALSVAAGWWAVRRRRLHLHRRLMLVGATLGALFFVSYAARTLVVGDTSFGGPAAWRAPYQAFLQAHSLLATVAGVFGVVTLRRAFLRRFRQHRRVAPWTAGLWLCAAATGLAVFLLLYVVFPPGATTNLFRAVTGH
jgi:putative membrane protein